MAYTRINMTDGAISFGDLPATTPQDKMMGGRAIIDWYMTEFVSPRVHPLARGNPLIVAPGLLAGSSAPSSARLSVEEKVRSQAG